MDIMVSISEDECDENMYERTKRVISCNHSNVAIKLPLDWKSGIAVAVFGRLYTDNRVKTIERGGL